VIPKSYFIARYKTLPQGPAVAEGCWYLANKSFAASQNIGEIGPDVRRTESFTGAKGSHL
jgi:hypothetical protein